MLRWSATVFNQQSTTVHAALAETLDLCSLNKPGQAARTVPKPCQTMSIIIYHWDSSLKILMILMVLGYNNILIAYHHFISIIYCYIIMILMILMVI